MTDRMESSGTARRRGIRRLCAILFSLVPAALPAWVAISVTLSYFKWSPLGYEPCGLQGVAWFLLIYPMLAVVFLIRSVVMTVYRLPRRFLLFPVVLGVLFLPMALFSGVIVPAIIGCVMTALVFLVAMITDFMFWNRTADAEKRDN